MDEWEDEIDEELFEDEETDLTEESEVTPQEEAFMQGYDEADKIANEERESADFADASSK